MRSLNEYEPFSNEHNFKKRDDVSRLEKTFILARWMAIKLLVPKEKYLSWRYPDGIFPPKK